MQSALRLICLHKNDPIKVMSSIGELYKNSHASDIGRPPIALRLGQPPGYDIPSSQLSQTPRSLLPLLSYLIKREWRLFAAMGGGSAGGFPNTGDPVNAGQIQNGPGEEPGP